MTARNPNDAAPVASQPPFAGTDSTRNVLATEADSRSGAKRGRIFDSLAMLRLDAELRRIRSRTKRHDPQPCVVCASTTNVVGHHHDYFAPQSLVWLCRSHHRRLHVRLSKRGRDPVDVYFKQRSEDRPAPFEGREWSSDEVRAVNVARYEESSRRMKALYAQTRGA